VPGKGPLAEGTRPVHLEPMQNGGDKSAPESLSVLSFIFELAVYAGLVTGYFFLVLHFLGGALKDLFLTNKFTYAVVALALIVGQGVLLQTLTTYLLRFFQHLLKRK
jgi:hypothetical protein